MTVVEDPSVAETLDASARERVFGHDFLWYPADPARGFDPVTDIAIGDDAGPDAEWMAAVVEHCAQGLSLLESVDPSRFDTATSEAWAVGVEQLRRQAAAAGIAVADHLDATQPFRHHGFFTAKAWMKHRHASIRAAG